MHLGCFFSCAINRVAPCIARATSLASSFTRQCRWPFSATQPISCPPRHSCPTLFLLRAGMRRLPGANQGAGDGGGREGFSRHGQGAEPGALHGIAEGAAPPLARSLIHDFPFTDVLALALVARLIAGIAFSVYDAAATCRSRAPSSCSTVLRRRSGRRLSSQRGLGSRTRPSGSTLRRGLLTVPCALGLFHGDSSEVIKATPGE